MRRIGFAFTFIMIVVMVLLPNYVFAIDNDITPPTINTITLNSSSVKSGENVTFTFDTSDDLSGVNVIMIEWKLEGTDGQNKNHLVYQVQDIKNEKFTKEYIVPSDTLPGKWIASAIQIWDGNMNLRTYTQGDAGFDISTLNLTISNDSKIDTEAPKLVSAQLKATTFEAPINDIELETVVTDNTSKIISIQIDYAVNGNFSNSASSGTQKVSDNKYTFKFSIDSKYKKYILADIRLEDESGNTVYYTYHEDYFPGSEKLVHLDTNLDLIPTNYIEDTEAPKLLSWKNVLSEIVTPGSVETEFEIEDVDTSDNWMGTAYYKNENNSFNKQTFISHAYDDNGLRVSDTQYTARLDIGRYDEPGDIYLYKVVLHDPANNTSEYSVENGKLEKKFVKITSDTQKYDLVTSSNINDYIEKIAVLPEGSKVLCNITKNSIIPKKLFDAIKGKDVEINFENVYTSNSNEENGVQWIINGKSIVNETKDVDMSIEFYLGNYISYLGLSYNQLYEKYKTLIMTCNKELLLNRNSGKDEGTAVNDAKSLQTKYINEFFASLDSSYPNQEEYKNKVLASISYYASFDAVLMHGLGSEKYIGIRFASNGLLPGNVTVRVRPQYAMRYSVGTGNLTLYFVDNENADKQDIVVSYADGFYTFNISHNSEYWIASKTLAKTEATNSENSNIKATNSTEISGTNSEAVDPSNGNSQYSNTSSTTSPNTGDQNIVMLFTLLIISGLGILLIGNRRKHYTNKTHV